MIGEEAKIFGGHREKQKSLDIRPLKKSNLKNFANFLLDFKSKKKINKKGLLPVFYKIDERLTMLGDTVGAMGKQFVKE